MKTRNTIHVLLALGILGAGTSTAVLASPAVQGSQSNPFQTAGIVQRTVGQSAATEAALHRAAAPEVRESSVAGSSFGLTELEGGLLGVGPDYKVRFDSGGFSFTPALGSKAERNHSLSFQLESVRRGDATFFHADGTSIPVKEGNQALFHHGAGVLEQYDILSEGIEQSFVFDTLPVGSGDLVVRGSLATDLAFAGASEVAGGIRFELADLGGVTIGAVTGIDAEGQTAAGTLWTDGTVLELSLPASFVDRAVPPLVLDPLIGTEFGVTSGFDDAFSDLAYDYTNDLYLVVWQRTFSAIDTDVYGQRIDPRGNPLGGLIQIETAFSTVSLEPTVAIANQTNRFLVAWQEGPSIFGPWEIKSRAVNAFDGVVSAGTTTLSSGLGVSIRPDAGGESTTLFDNVLVVWEDINLGIQGRAVQVPAGNSDPVNQAAFSLTSNATDTEPEIAKSGGLDGQYLVVWHRFFSLPTPGDLDVQGAVVDRFGTITVPTTPITANNFNDEKFADVDGDGRSWMIVFQSEVVPNVGDNDIHCKVADLTTPTLTVAPGEVVIEADFDDDEVHPAITDAGEKFFIAWSDEFDPFDFDIMAIGVDPMTCAICEPEFFVDFSTTRDERPSMASQLSGDLNSGDQALLIWQSQDLSPPFDSDINAQLLEAIGDGGVVTLLGGSCGQGGTVSVNGPVAVGNSSFGVLLSGADPTAMFAIFNLNLGGLGTAFCGSCELTAIGALFPAQVIRGDAFLSLPIPCDAALVGQDFEGQWGVLGNNGGACPPVSRLSVSDRIGVQVDL